MRPPSSAPKGPGRRADRKAAPPAARLAPMVLALLLAAPVAAQPAPAAPAVGGPVTFDVLLDAAKKQGRAPRLDEPGVGPALRALTDEKALAAAPQGAAGLGAIMPMCDAANRAVVAYALFGVDRVVDPKAAPEQLAAAVQALQAENVRLFQDELTILQPYTLDCMGRGIPALEDFMKTLPPEQWNEVRKEGLRKMRVGLTQLFTGVALILRETREMKPAYRTALLEALARNAETFASVIPLEIRKNVKENIGKGFEASPLQERPATLKILQALSSPDCKGLCAL